VIGAETFSRLPVKPDRAQRLRGFGRGVGSVITANPLTKLIGQRPDRILQEIKILGESKKLLKAHKLDEIS
jgi:hypothetical protein